MTLRVTLGIDPGLSGAIAVVADGVPVEFIDMPTMTRQTGKGREIDVKTLHGELRRLWHSYPGAYFLAVLEKVCGYTGQSASLAFNFGQADGMVRATLVCVNVPKVEVYPQSWKARLGLTGKEKDAGRVLAISLFPSVAHKLARKKDGGRADALLLARYAEIVEQQARAA